MFLRSFLYCPAAHRALPSFPTRRSSDLCGRGVILRLRSACNVGRSIYVERDAEADIRITGSEKTRVHERRSDRKSTRLNSSHLVISYAVFCLKKKKNNNRAAQRRQNSKA